MNQGSQIGHYHILRPLGAGGMGEVYLAEDTSLKRQVAVKVLPERLRASEERLKRFRREAEAAASLKHPNIATIYSLEEIDHQLLIVMEHVEGHTLKEAIPEGGMEIEQFFETFIPLADALAHAHAQGRIHRDLKPANIMITEDGTPKILDFGLARIIDPDAVEAYSDTDLGEDDATQTMKEGVPSLTRGGQLIGTPQYMSPEQAERKDTDARTDIFSFGLVMYEALTGQRAFDGDSLESIIGRILEAEPKAVTELKPITPYTLWTVIRRCIAKKSDRRMQTAPQLVAELEAVQQDIRAGTVLVDASTIPQAEAVSRERIPIWKQPLAIGVVVLVTLMLSIPGTWYLKPIHEPPLRKFQWPVEGLSQHPVISPDASMIAYTTGTPTRIWVRDLDKTTAREISGSEGAVRLFWSPNSDFIGYEATVENRIELRRVSVQGGPVTTLSQFSGGPGNWGPAVWRSDGTIIIPKGIGLISVPARGGNTSTIVKPDSSAGQAFLLDPQLLPDGQTLVFTSWNQDNTSDLLVQHGESYRVLYHGNANEFLSVPVYSPSGHMLYYTSGTIWAVPFDPSTRETTGDPFIVSEDAGWPSVARDGTLVYRSSSPYSVEQQLVWLDRIGRLISTIDQPRKWRINDLALSPDDRQLAVTAEDQGQYDIWIYDLERGMPTRFTSDPARVGASTWSPDGSELIFSSYHSGNPDLVRRRVDGTGTAMSVVSTPSFEFGPEWSGDGQYLLYTSRVNLSTSSSDLWVLDFSSNKKPVPLFETSHSERASALSPNGQYLAYTSNESGHPEVYIRQFPDGVRLQISVDGGRVPRWNGQGTELFFESNGNLMAVKVSLRDGIRADIPEALFALPSPPSGIFSYDVHSDGQKFVMVHPIEESTRTAPTITVVMNWFREFEGIE
jgi:eukaryotic-like serine/threonine-protein kinase